MPSDFKPVHLQEANAKLDRHVLLLERYKKSERYKKYDDAHKAQSIKISLWRKFLGLFKTSSFTLPEDLYK